MIRPAMRVVQVGLMAALATFWVLTLRPQPLAGPAAYLVVRGDSMLPTYETGDLLVLRRDLAYGVGDVVGYRVPAGELGEGHVIVHRIVGGDAATGWIMLGDNNPAPDPWTPRDGDVVGRPWLVVPQAGRVVAWVHQPVILAGLAAAVVVAMVIARPAGPSPSRSPGTRPAIRRLSRRPSRAAATGH